MNTSHQIHSTPSLPIGALRRLTLQEGRVRGGSSLTTEAVRGGSSLTTELLRGGSSLFLLIFFSLSLFAQQPQGGDSHQQFNPQEFQQRLEQAITRETCFTTEEAAAFFPVYKEMKQKQRLLANQVRDLKRQLSHNASASETDYQTTLTRIKQLQIEMAEVERDYYQRLCVLVPPSKVFKAMQAEDRFHRNMVRERRGQGQPPKHPAKQQ